MGPGQKPPDSGRPQSGQGQWWPLVQWLKRTLAWSSSNVTQLCRRLQEDRRRTLTCSGWPRLRSPFSCPLPGWLPGWPSGSAFLSLWVCPCHLLRLSPGLVLRGGGGTLGPINCRDSPQPVCTPPELTPACSGPTSCPSGHSLTWTWGHSPTLNRFSLIGRFPPESGKVFSLKVHTRCVIYKLVALGK